jgi:carbon-monoxide dehydrogenase medium subunit
MHPAPFAYVRVDSVAEALAALADRPDARLLAGGHSLLPALKLRLAQPATLIDIGRVAELTGIAAGDERLRIGALATHDRIARAPEVASAATALAEACAQVGDPAVRNWGTLGGNVAHADPASDPPAALAALGATLELTSRNGVRRVPAAEFFVDLFLTQLGADEIITAIELPAGGAAAGTGAAVGSAYVKQPHPASGYAVCGAAAVVRLDQAGRCAAARLAIGGAAAAPVTADLPALAGAAPDRLQPGLVGDVLAALRIDDPLEDAYAPGSYRVHLARVLGRRALLRAAARAAPPPASA